MFLADSPSSPDKYNWFRAKKTFSSGIVEGVNAKAKVATRKAYGFETFKTLKLAYHTLRPTTRTGNRPQIIFLHGKKLNRNDIFLYSLQHRLSCLYMRNMATIGNNKRICWSSGISEYAFRLCSSAVFIFFSLYDQ